MCITYIWILNRYTCTCKCTSYPRVKYRKISRLVIFPTNFCDKIWYRPRFLEKHNHMVGKIYITETLPIKWLVLYDLYGSILPAHTLLGEWPIFGQIQFPLFPTYRESWYIPSQIPKWSHLWPVSMVGWTGLVVVQFLIVTIYGWQWLVFRNSSGSIPKPNWLYHPPTKSLPTRALDDYS